MKFLLASSILFLYIYSISFNFLPVSTRVLFGIFGFIWFILYFMQKSQHLCIYKNLFILILLLFSIGFIAMISITLNGSTDIEFIKYVVSMSTIVFASYFVVRTLDKLKYKLDFLTISQLIINAILIQSVIAFTMFLVPDFRDAIITIQSITSDALEKMQERIELRIIGFGAAYFAAGIINGFALLSIGILLKIYTFSSKQILILSLKFLVILVVGMMMARTTMIGGLLGLILIFMPKDFKATVSTIQKQGLFLFYIIVFPLLLMAILYFSFPKIVEILESALNFGFEIFINYYENGKIESASTNQLQQMYIFPDNIKTWLIGDGYYSNPNGDGYYMHTDVGYSRLIYYFGLLGLSAFLITQYYVISQSLKNLRIKFDTYIFFYIYLLILNLKGFTDLLLFSLLFYMIMIFNKHKQKVHMK